MYVSKRMWLEKVVRKVTNMIMWLIQSGKVAFLLRRRGR